MSLEVDSTDVLRLIQHHLTECGLHATCRALREESGIGAAAAHSNLRSLSEAGSWGDVLEVLDSLDPKRCPIPSELIADVHEMAILELADAGEIELSIAALRLAEDELNDRTSSVERRITTLIALRKTSLPDPDPSAILPPDYYGNDNTSRQTRRTEIGRKLGEAILQAPRGRLLELIQQAIKWQAHTGRLATLSDDEDVDAENDEKRKRKKKKKRYFGASFDLVLGEAAATRASTAGKGDSKSGTAGGLPAEPIPSREAGTIKFGKKSHPECAAFLPDGSALVTGSSDGFVELWDPAKWGKLRTHDLPYQRNDELLLHDAPVLSVTHSTDGEMLATGSSDGTLKVWNIATGKCLRQFEKAHSNGISCLAFGRDGSRVLTGSHDFSSREFGLRAAKMLKEFRGHASYVNTCGYLYDDAVSLVGVVTGSADGTVRIWDGKTSEVRYVLRLGADGPDAEGALLSVANADETLGRNIHSVLIMHTPANTLIVVPRGPKAYLVNTSGAILRTYERTDNRGDGSDFVAATVSPSNRWLYLAAEDRKCICFDVATCETAKAIDMGEGGEVSGLCHHPHRGLLAGFSSDKMKRGILKLWK